MNKQIIILISIFICISLVALFIACEKNDDDDDDKNKVDHSCEDICNKATECDTPCIEGDCLTYCANHITISKLECVSLSTCELFNACICAGDDDDDDDNDASDDDDDDDDDNDDDYVEFTCEGEVCYDPDTSLMWQKDSGGFYEWSDAITYCDELIFAGYSDWHLPTISELRSLVRGCEDTETGGGCNVTDDCLEYSCIGNPCVGCNKDEGPADGCYWPEEIDGVCSYYWSSSSVTDRSEKWFVYFPFGLLLANTSNELYEARCVRPYK